MRTIEEIANVVRKSGYSLLSDEEIDRYIEWVSELRAASHESVERVRLSMAQGEQMRDDARKAYERAQSNFRRACSISPTFEVIADEQA